MRKILLALLIVFVLTFGFVPAAQAAVGQPVVGSCPTGFETHEVGMHEGEHHEHHIGLTVDLNDDGLICVRHLANGLHVHADNVIR